MLAGSLYTVAGTGTCGQVGDGGSLATAAALGSGRRRGRARRATSSCPTWELKRFWILPSRTGDLLRRSHSGRITWRSVAGIGLYGPYLVDGLPATGQTAELNSPVRHRASTASGDLLISDTYSSCIREMPERRRVGAWYLLVCG